MVNTGNTNTILHTPIPRTTTHRFCQLTNNELSFRHATCLSQLPAQSLSLVFSLSLSPSPSLFFLLYDSLQGNFVLSCLFSWTSLCPRTPASSFSFLPEPYDQVDALLPPSRSPFLDFSFPVDSKDTPPLCQVLFHLRTTFHRRHGHRRYLRTPVETEAVDAGAQGGCI